MKKRNHFVPVKLAIMISAFFSVVITGAPKKEIVGAEAVNSRNASVNLTDYYASADGANDAALRIALYNIIKGHNSGSYDNAYVWLRTIDKKADGTMWDMYSDVPNGTPPYTFSQNNACGNYSKEGDCWNREHIVPQSIFNEASPMVSDVHHVVATDGSVNGRRSNYPFGEVQNPTWTSLNGSKLGSGKSETGYTSTVFEPIDEYKGDIARSIMYMVVRYQNVMNGWDSFAMFNKTASNLGFSPWARNLMLKWSIQDSVSEKEISRNNLIYENYQENRNPFIDRPSYACSIWGDIDDNARNICASAPTDDVEVTFVISLINSIGLVTHSSENVILEAEAAYSQLTPDQKLAVTNYQVLIDARNTFNNLGEPLYAKDVLFDFESEHGGADNAKSATVEIINDSIVTPDVSNLVSSIDIVSMVRTQMNYGLSLGSNGGVGKITLNFTNPLPITSVEVTAIKYAKASSSTITLNDNFGVGSIGEDKESRGTISWNLGSGSTLYDKITFSSTDSSDDRATILSLKLILQTENPAIQELIELIDSFDIDNITLSDDDAIDRALSLYSSLNNQEKTLITNYSTLLLVLDIFNNLLLDFAVASDVIELINSLFPVSLDSKTLIEQAELVYSNLTDSQKNYVSNYPDLVQARQTYDEHKAQVVTNLINNIGTVTLSSKTKLDQAQSAYDALENANQRSLVSNYVDLSLKQLTYNGLVAESDLIPSLENATWSNTDVANSPHTITEPTRSYGLSSGKLENGETYLGADASNADKLVFNEENGFAGLESMLTKSYTYYAGFMMLDFAFSNPTSITFSWSDVTTTFEVSLLASFDGGNTWDAIANLDNITQGGSVSWTRGAQSKDVKGLANPNDYSFAQYAIVTGSNEPGFMENLAIATSFDGRQFSTDSELDTLIALVETADTCRDFVNSLALGALYDLLDQADKEIFDMHIGSDGVNVKVKLDYMIVLYLSDNSSGSNSPSLLNTIKEKQTLILVSLISIISLLTVSYIQKRKTAIDDC